MSVSFRLNYIIALIILLSIFFIKNSYSQDINIEAQKYKEAYNICAPAVASRVKEQCNYASWYESYYKQCMSDKGFAENEDLDETAYKSYVLAYKDCRLESDQYAKLHCNYDLRYKSLYNDCMSRFGFNEDGSYVGAPNDEDKGSGDKRNYFQFDF